MSFVISGCSQEAAPPRSLLASAPAQRAGAAVYTDRCAICHGTDSAGDGPSRADMNPPPANLAQPPWSEASNARRTFRAIRRGVRGTAMPAWTQLSDEDVWDVIAYLTSGDARARRRDADDPGRR